MRRREFIAGLAFATVAGATGAHGAQRVFRLALISNSYDARDLADPARRANFVFWPAFLAELRRLGYAEGENLAIEWFSTATNTAAEILPAVLQSKPDVIYANGPALFALNRASNGIPVLTIIADPMANGFTQSLSKPDGNVTGLTGDGGIELIAKSLQIISELVGKPTSVGALRSQRYNDPTPWLASLITAGERLGMPIIVVKAEEPLGREQYRRAIHAAAQKKIGALLETGNDHIAFYRTIVALAAEEKLPTLFTLSEAPVRMGGLAAYYVDLNDQGRRLAGYVDRILKGATVADLPFSQPITFRLVINTKTARELGLTVPQSLLVRADEVIE
jgi:putative tryptophan/tyrosine transport system substrate-binding protein